MLSFVTLSVVYAECCIFIVMLSVVIPSVIILSVVTPFNVRDKYYLPSDRGLIYKPINGNYLLMGKISQSACH